ncbi:hypothetical protein POVCU2_0021590 [Plasmodium ovale curtisi]|uniref:Uncharacterized protein n=1 Tax=Plasmodium ovale curtisi TaxID=864141 RepID=A0A1A8VW26_PLAOA|nr:hypothetical protein POVCU2_0021590 [Plasmodium ovale curtisi]
MCTISCGHMSGSKQTPHLRGYSAESKSNLEQLCFHVDSLIRGCVNSPTREVIYQVRSCEIILSRVNICAAPQGGRFKVQKKKKKKGGREIGKKSEPKMKHHLFAITFEKHCTGEALLTV